MPASDLINAVKGGVPTNDLKPHNCHEAVLGWVLLGKYPEQRIDRLPNGTQKGWMSLRIITDRVGGNNPKQLTGTWVGTFYQKMQPQQITGPTPNRFQLGDIVCMGGTNAPTHSMVIVEVTASVARAMGFNNAGGFGAAAGFMTFDSTPRDLLEGSRWSNGKFLAVNGPTDVHRIGCADYESAIIRNNHDFQF